MSLSTALPPRALLDCRAIHLLERYFGLRGSDEPALFGMLQTVHLAGGDWLFHQGDPGDCLYFLVRGRLKVWRDAEDIPGEEDILLGEVTPGESVGEAGLLAGHGRSAGVRAIRDSQLVRVDRAAFEQMAARNPSLVMKLAASVADRLRQNMEPARTDGRPLKTIALLPLDDTPRCRAFCDALVAGLVADGRTIDLHRDTLAASGAPCAGPDSGEAVSAQLKDWLVDLELDSLRVVYRCDASASPWSTFCLRQADLVLRVAEATADPRARGWEQSLDASCARVGGSLQALVLLQAEAALPITGTLSWLEARRLDFHLHARADRPEDVQRAVRVVAGRATGLVLGAGGARGFAHVGVHEALQEASVPIDWFGGSSIGAIMAAGQAYDWPEGRVRAVAFEAFVKGKPFSDYTLPMVSLLSGGRMRKLLRAHLPGNIEDLPLPFFCVSSNLSTGRSNVHQRGPVWKALCASAALPGVMPPAVHLGQLAIDGSVLNSLPVDVMQQMPVAKVIAVDLSTRKEYQIDYKHVPSAWSMLRSKWFGGKRARVPVLATLMLKSTEIGTVARVRELGARADLLLSPPVDRFNILDVTRFHDIVQAGYLHTQEKLPEWLAVQAAVASAEATRD